MFFFFFLSLSLSLSLCVWRGSIGICKRVIHFLFFLFNSFEYNWLKLLNQVHTHTSHVFQTRSHLSYKWQNAENRPTHMPQQQSLIYWKRCQYMQSSDKVKRDFLQAVVVSVLLHGCTTWTQMKSMEKKTRWELLMVATSRFEQILKAALYKIAAVWPLSSHLKKTSKWD